MSAAGSGDKARMADTDADADALSMLTDGSGRSLDVSYSPEEADLNALVTPHAMWNLECLNQPTLQRLCSLIEREPIKIPDLAVISKSYEDQFMRPAKENRGERPCVLGSECICKYLARIRYGPETDRGFVCTEFLLPVARDAWLDGKGLPEIHGKCLVCLRYFTTYAYYHARSDPQFGELSRKLATQKYTNTFATNTDTDAGDPPASKRARASPTCAGGVATGDAAWHDARADAVALPTHANVIDSVDGYRREAALFVDESAANSAAMRTERIGAVIFRSVVRFRSGDYAYRVFNGESRLVQVGIGVDDTAPRRHLNEGPSLAPAELVAGIRGPVA